MWCFLARKRRGGLRARVWSPAGSTFPRFLLRAALIEGCALRLLTLLPNDTPTTNSQASPRSVLGGLSLPGVPPFVYATSHGRMRNMTPISASASLPAALRCVSRPERVYHSLVSCRSEFGAAKPRFGRCSNECVHLPTVAARFFLA